MLDNTDDLFGEPPLIKGEDSERYSRLLAGVTQEIQPKLIFEKLLVRDITNKIWEQQRNKQNVAALVTSTFIEALKCLLDAAMKPEISLEDNALNYAREYYSSHTQPDRLKEIVDYMCELGIEPEHVRAKAMQLCGSDVSMFNRMSDNCETTLRQLRRELERSQNLKRSSLATKQVGEEQIESDN